MRPSRQGIPRLGEQWKATNHAAAFPGKLMKPTVAFGIRQRKPKTVEETLNITLELELYLTPSSGPSRVAQVDLEEPTTQEAIVMAVKSQQDAMLDLMSKLVDRLERLEVHDQTAD